MSLPMAGGLEPDDLECPFQPKTLCDSVNLFQGHPGSICGFSLVSLQNQSNVPCGFFFKCLSHLIDKQ